MEQTSEIIKRYRQAYSNERISLFLQFPDLRDLFIDIELKNPAVEIDHSIFSALRFIT